MNCRDALRLLYDFVDKEAPEQDASQVEDHLKKCRHCSAKYELEMKFKQCIEQKGSLSPDCDELRNKIAVQLDDIEPAAGDIGPFGPPF